MFQQFLGPAPIQRARLFSPCQVLTANSIQQMIATTVGRFTAPLHAIPGVTATLHGVSVDCATGTAAISIQIRYQSGGTVLTGTVRVFATLEPAPLGMLLSPAIPCLRVRSRVFDLLDFPTGVLQQIEAVIRMIFSGVVCLSAPPVVSARL